MIIKYWTDVYGNEFHGPAQTGKKKEILLNPEYQSLTPHPQHGPDMRIRLVNGAWVIEKIDPHHKRLPHGEIVPKSERELMRDIPDKFLIPKGMKLVEIPISEQAPDGLILEPKTIDEKFTAGEVTEQEIYQIKLADCIESRRTAYVVESDPLFFKWQRGEKEKYTWIDAVDAIKARYPKPE